MAAPWGGLVSSGSLIARFSGASGVKCKRAEVRLVAVRLLRFVTFRQFDARPGVAL